MLALFALLISSRSVCEKPPPPQLFDSTRTLAAAPKICFAWIANSMALTAPTVLPLPFAPRNFSAMMLAVQLMPVTPTPLFARAPMVPETCVPWLLSTMGWQLFAKALKPWLPAGHVYVLRPMGTTKLDGADQTLPARS